MWGLRRQVSLLLDHGHPAARKYPLGMVWEEALIVTERVNLMVVTQAQLTRMAISASFSNKGHAHFKEQIKRLVEDG